MPRLDFGLDFGLDLAWFEDHWTTCLIFCVNIGITAQLACAAISAKPHKPELRFRLRLTFTVRIAVTLRVRVGECLCQPVRAPQAKL